MAELNSRSLPSVSILLPVRNEEAYIGACLRAVFAQRYPHELMEILIADGDSSDGTPVMIRSLTSETQIPLTLLTNRQRIVPKSMNMLLPLATGEIVIRVDGHCVIAPDYVTNCVNHLLEGDVDGVGGPVHTIGEKFVSEVIALAMSSKFGVGNSAFRTETGQTHLADTVPFPAYTREIIAKAGMYDEELVRDQDDEYNCRIRELGGKILLAADVRSVYYSRVSLDKLWKQYFEYGFWKVRVLQKHPRQMSARQFVPPAFVLSLVLTLILALATTWGWMALGGLMGVYLLLNLGVSTCLAAHNGWKPLALLPGAFLLIHLGYGSGFLIGLLRFWKRWGDRVGLVPPLNLAVKE